MGLLYSPFSFRRKKGLWIYWGITLMVCLWIMYLIFCFSAANSTNSSHLSGGISKTVAKILLTYFHGFFGQYSISDLAQMLEHPVRKIAHFSEYTLLSFVLQLHFSGVWHLRILSSSFGISQQKHWWIAIISAVLYAVSDEIHQYFVPGRACRLFDVFVDSCGVFFGFLIFFLIFRGLLDGVFFTGYNEEK